MQFYAGQYANMSGVERINYIVTVLSSLTIDVRDSLMAQRQKMYSELTGLNELSRVLTGQLGSMIDGHSKYRGEELFSRLAEEAETFGVAAYLGHSLNRAAEFVTAHRSNQ